MRRGLVVAALMMAMSLAALDSTVVGTAMPTIVGQLGGLALFSWVFSVYLLASTVTVPLYGRLADLYGRKPIIMAGAALFLGGSALCGLAQTMEQLIMFRAIQGLGAGAVQPITITIIGDIFSIEQRARIQGLFSSVWGISSVVGPALGGLITDHASWRWVFYVNLPLGITSIIFLWLYYKEEVHRQGHRLDYWGTILLTGSVTSLLIAVLENQGNAGVTGGLFALAAFLLGLFVWQEGRTPEPAVPLWLFRHRVIAISSLATLVGGGLQFGVSSFIPLFAQGVLGGTATSAGLVLAPMSIGWPLGSVIGGRIILKLGYYTPSLVGSAFLALGSLILLSLSRDSGPVAAMVASLIVGLGLGFTSVAFIISVQNAVGWGQRGIATASVQFFRTIGGSIGVAIMGAILNSQMASRLGQIAGVPPQQGADILLNASARSALAPSVLEAMQRALAASLHQIYFLVLALALASVAVVLFFPRGRAHELAYVGATAAADPAPAKGRPEEESASVPGSIDPN